MKRCLVLAALVLPACSPPPDTHERHIDIDSEVIEYVGTFQTELTRHGINLVVNDLVVKMVDDLDPGEQGRCSIRTNTTPLIRISRAHYKNYFDRGMYSDIESLMYHELGHCLLGYDHNNSMIGTRYGSIMNMYHIDGATYAAHKEEYLNELFTNPRKYRVYIP